jgi:hypothetical protein
MKRWEDALGYRLEWHVETESEIRGFPKRFQATIRRKLQTIAAGWPQSARLKSVQPIRGQENLGIQGQLFEVDIGAGPRAGILVDSIRQVITVYLVGTHDYAKANYLKAADRRLA